MRVSSRQVSHHDRLAWAYSHFDNAMSAERSYGGRGLQKNDHPERTRENLMRLARVRGARENPHRYFSTTTTYQGLCIDTRAGVHSNAGKAQALAFVKEHPKNQIDWTRKGESFICFGAGKLATSIGTITITSNIGCVTFFIFDTSLRHGPSSCVP